MNHNKNNPEPSDDPGRPGPRKPKRSGSGSPESSSRRSSNPRRSSTSRPASESGYKPRSHASSQGSQKKRLSASGGHVPEPFNDAERGVRLHKVMAEAGVASRRQCEQLIAQGLVRINGQLVTGSPAWVNPAEDRIEVEGKTLALTPTEHQAKSLMYVILHKPKRYVSTTQDPEGRPTVMDLLPASIKGRGRVYPVGRLDSDSTGLMLLTNDGQLAHRLTHPSYEVAKRYLVSVQGQLSDDDVAALKKGLILAHRGRGGSHSEGGRRSDQAKVKKASVSQVRLLGRFRDKTRGDRTQLAITLREGQNREIRRMLARLGHNVKRLRRTAIGPLKLRGLAVGQFRPLTKDEVRQLYHEVGLDRPRH